MAIIGIDLGTTNSVVAVWEDGESKLIENAFGEVLTPSVVSIDDNDNIIVGKIAKERMITNPNNTISVFKRTMGTDKKYKLGNNKYSSEELSAYVIMQLKADAEKYLGVEVEEAVISVPAYFDDKQRNATRLAGQIAGLKVRRLINEPSAAALACRMCGKRKTNLELYVNGMQRNIKMNKEQDVDKTYMVFDFGGGTLDVSLVECFDNVISVVAVSGNNKLGGSDIDIRIAKEFCVQNNIEYSSLSDESKAILLKNAEVTKISLSSNDEATLHMDTDDLKGSITIDKAKLSQICSDILLLLIKPYQKVLLNSDFDKESIDDIVLIGGTGKMPLVSDYLEYKTGIKPVTIGTPDTMVALGLGAYVGIVERKDDIKDIIITDVCPFSLGISVLNRAEPCKDLMGVIIEKNTILPTTKKHSFSTAYDNQEKVCIEVYQGEDRYVDNNLFIDKFDVSMPKGPKGTKFTVSFSYDIDGILDVEVILKDGKKINNVIVRNNNLSEEYINSMKEKFNNMKSNDGYSQEVIYVKELAESLYCQTSGKLREAVNEIIYKYEMAIQNATPLNAKNYTNEAKLNLERIKEYIENYGMKDDFNNF